MSTRKILSAIATALGVAAATSTSAGTYFENFTTTAFRDPVATTAEWSTTAAELRLPAFSVSSVGSLDTSGSAGAVAVSGDLACIADGSAGLQVIDVSDPTAPSPAGTYDTPSLAAGVAIAGDHAYVADQISGVQIIDIGSPGSPVLAGSYNTTGVANDVAVSGNHAFVADLNGGLVILDVSDPTAPALLGTLATPGSAAGVDVAGDHAYVADSGSGLLVVDVTNPASPVIEGTLATSANARRVVVRGDHAFVAESTDGLLVIDVSDPTNPLLAGSLSTGSPAQSVAVAGDFAYVSAGFAGLLIVDVSDPANPTMSEAVLTSNAALAADVSGDHAFIADNSAGLHVVQVSELVTSPPAVGVYDTPDYANDVEISGNHAFVADWSTGLVILDVTDPAAPSLAGTYDTGGNALGVTVAGDHAFVGDTVSGLQIIDVSDPTAPTLSGTYNTPDVANEVIVAGDHAFVADFSSGLLIVDVSDPTSPALTGQYNSFGIAYGVAVAGHYAFLADGSWGLQVIDVSDPSAPTSAGGFFTPGSARAVAVSGHHAYVAAYDAGLWILDVSDPTSLTFAGSLDTGGLAAGVAVCGNQAFVGDDSSGVLVVDVSDPTNPVLVGGSSVLTEAERVAVSGRHAFVTDGTSGLRALHIRQDEVSLTEGAGQSVPVYSGSDPLPRARVTPTQTAGISWELSPDAGASWVSLADPSSWALFPTPGNGLVWRSKHTWAPGVNPTVSDLTVEWLTEMGPIAAVTDVPDDQGGEVRVEVTRSGYDFADEPTYPVVGYQVYQRVDSTSAFRRMSESPAPDAADLEGTPLAAFETSRVRKAGGRTFVLGGTQGAAGTFPPGLWEAVGWIAATQSDSYLARVTTTGDSSGAGPNWAVYFVTTHTTTPSVWFGSAPDSGYSVDNLAPAPPTNLSLGGPATLVWDPAPEADFAVHTVYGSASGVLDGSAIVLDTTALPTLDVSASPHPYYHVTTSDHAGNESGAATLAGGVVGSPEVAGLPVTLRLHSPRPNPMRSRGTLRFDLPNAQTVRLVVYDVAGRRVRELASGAFAAGTHAASWDGRAEDGRRVSAGIYFARLEADGSMLQRRIVVVR